MKVSGHDLRQLIQVVFIALYQFIALRELHKLGPDANQTDFSDSIYELIWRLAGYEGAPERPCDEYVTGGEWQAYVDDELINASALALQNAWKVTQSKKCPTRLFTSNFQLVNFYKLNADDLEDRWVMVVEKLTKAENKWRQAIRKETKRKKGQTSRSSPYTSDLFVVVRKKNSKSLVIFAY